MNPIMRRSSRLYCCVTGCISNSESRPNIAFFSQPRDEARRMEWLRLISREDLMDVGPNSKLCKICEDHFPYDHMLVGDKRKILKRSARPSCYLPPLQSHSLEPEIQHKGNMPSTSKLAHLTSKLTQTERDWDDEIEGSKIAAKTVSVADCHQINIEKVFNDLCLKFLSKDLTALIEAQEFLKHKRITSDQHEYSKFCFNLYQTSPQAAQFFQSTYDLPSCDLLLKQHVQMGTIINDNVMSTLKRRVEKMSVKERNCSVLFESVKLKENLCYNIKEDKIYGFQEVNGVQYPEPATMALIVMVKGIFFTWKQPIGYILIPQNYDENLIQNWINCIIKRLFEIGLNIKTLVSSTEDDWINAIVCGKGLSVDAPYFYIGDKKIYNIFDAADLVKSARDCMLSYDIHFGNQVAKYEDIIQFFDADQKKSLPYAQELTNSHINPNDKEKQEVKYAVQVMSKTVANGLWTYIHFDLIKNANIGTVEFITHLSNLFDILNVSQKINHDTASNREKKSYDDILNEMSFFQNLKVIDPKNGQDVTRLAKFVKCIMITVKSYLLLSDDLKAEGHNLMLVTKNLHKKALDDYLKKMTSCIRGKPSQPTTIQFTVAFRKFFLKYLKVFTQRGNAKDEITNFLAQINYLKEENAQIRVTDSLSEIAAQPIKISNPRSAPEYYKKIEKDIYDIFDISEKYSLLYVSAYLLMMSRKVHTACKVLKYYLYSHAFLENGRFQQYHKYMAEKSINLPSAPCDSFIQFVEEMDAMFVKEFQSKHLRQKIVASLMEDIANNKISPPPCPCFPKEYMVNLFLRIKIFHMIRVNNKSFKENKQNRIYFMVPKLAK